jgi:hypothetical protein
MHVSWSRTVAACAAIVACALPTLAFAAPGGVRIIVQQWTSTNPGVQSNDIVLDRPGLMSDALNAGWADARKPVCDALTAEAGLSQSTTARTPLRRARHFARRLSRSPTELIPPVIDLLRDGI